LAAGRRSQRTAWASGLAGALLVNLLLLAGLAFERPQTQWRDHDDTLSVTLRLAPERLAPPPPRAMPQARQARPLASVSAQPAPRPAVAPTAAPANAAPASRQPAGAGQGPPSSGEGAADGRVASALRGLVGCSQAGLLNLTPEERAACDQTRTRQADAAKGKVDPLPLQKRVYYDAVQQAYADMHDPRTPVPVKAGDQTWYSKAHGPGVGCKLGGKGAPPNSLKLGPCFISPPQGVLTEESAVQKPY
jgi:hypothetical protein